jgi:hypothetical protein
LRFENKSGVPDQKNQGKTGKNTKKPETLLFSGERGGKKF